LQCWPGNGVHLLHGSSITQPCHSYEGAPKAGFSRFAADVDDFLAAAG
jgi:hypothetical protein